MPSVNKVTPLANILRKDIISGIFGTQGGLPQANELAVKHNVSRNTVVTALTLLEGEKLIEKRGTIYYVNPQSQVLMTQNLLPPEKRAKFGFVYNVEPVRAGTLPKHLAELFGVDPSTEIIFCKRVSGNKVDGVEKVDQVAVKYFLLAPFASVIELMQNDPGFDPAWTSTLPDSLISQDEPKARMTTPEEESLFGLSAPTPINQVRESIEDKSGKIYLIQEVVLAPHVQLKFRYPFTKQNA